MSGFAELPDEQTHVERAQANPRDFAPLYDRYAMRVYKFFRYRVDDIATAEDLTAQTFERALADIARYQAERAPFAAWLFGIANNTVSSHYRVERRRLVRPLDNGPDPASDEPQPEQAAIDAETNTRLAHAVALLSDREREMIALKFAAGLANTDIAAITGCTDSNTGVILHRALQKLRRILSAEETIP
jgi:RNA polymerase sigma-70 factor (ECF subfamily)